MQQVRAVDKKTEAEMSKPGDLEEMFVLRVLYKQGVGVFVETTSGWRDKGMPVDLLRRILKKAWKKIPIELTHEARRQQELYYREHSLGQLRDDPRGNEQ
jgi:hypothetical protein